MQFLEELSVNFLKLALNNIIKWILEILFKNVREKDLGENFEVALKDISDRIPELFSEIMFGRFLKIPGEIPEEVTFT